MEDNHSVTLDSFLSFWNHYNTTIIEALIALIIVLSLFLGFRHFFVKETHSDLSGGGGSGSGDINQIEQTLKKILENQASTPAAPAAPAPSSEPEPAATASDPGGELLFTAADLQHFRDSLEEALAKNEELQKKISSLEKASEGAAAPSGNPALESELKSKVLDLEARLKEYELISDDIAELSRYREENAKLKAELSQAQSGKAFVISPEAEDSKETSIEKPSLSLVSENPVVEPSEEPVSSGTVGDLNVASLEPASPAASSGGEALASEVQTEAPALAPAVEPSVSNPLDEEFLKEFAEVVHGKKPDKIEPVSNPSPPAPEAGAADSDETQKLMNSFESFVANKKE